MNEPSQLMNNKNPAVIVIIKVPILVLNVPDVAGDRGDGVATDGV